jgi:ABC-type phosphate transport system substrate-binding protein
VARMATAVIVAAVVVANPLRPALAGTGGGFVVVVNEANPLDRLARADVSKLFLKRTTAWPNGVPAVPCDQSGTSPVRKAFSEAVHDKPAWVVVAFWQQEIASGRGAPPGVCQGDQGALQAVRQNPGGIAYVAEGVPLGPGVRALTVVP